MSQRRVALPVLLERDGDRCSLCNMRLNVDIKDSDSPWFVTIDHVVPRSIGGQDEIGNLRLAHRSCNMTRGSKKAST